MLKAYISLLERLSLVRTQMCHHILAKTLPIYYLPSLMLTPTRDQTLIKFFHIQWLKQELPNFSMSKISRMSSPIPSSIAKTFSTNSRPFSRRRKMTNWNRSKQKRQQRLLRKWLHWSLTSTSQSMDRTHNCLMRCSWITSITYINLGIPNHKHHHQTPFHNDHFHSKPQ